MVKTFAPALAAVALLLTACTSTNYRMPGNVESLHGLQEMNAIYVRNGFGGGRGSASAINEIRYTAVKETALSIGARAALAWRSKQINAVLIKNAAVLDQAYRFNGLTLPNDVLPPVLQEARNTLNLADPDTIRLASQVFRIKTQAHFVTTVPTWRDYLWMTYPEPERPDDSLLPKNRPEQAVWNRYTTEGWDHGMDQGTAIFGANLARLNTDYKGMALYQALYQENMVSAPFVAKAELGITGDGSEMSINDQILRITALPQLNLKGNTWKPILIPDPLAPYKLDLLRQMYPKSIPRGMQSRLYIK